MAGPFPLDDLFRKLGEFVVVFQAIDELLARVLAQIVAHEHWNEACPAFARLNFNEKVRLSASLLARRAQQIGTEDPAEEAQWAPQFKKLMDLCTKLANRRNGVIHATYEFVDDRGELLDVGLSQVKLSASGVSTVSKSPIQELDEAIVDGITLRFDLARAAEQVRRWIGRARPAAVATSSGAAPTEGNLEKSRRGERRGRDADCDRSGYQARRRVPGAHRVCGR